MTAFSITPVTGGNAAVPGTATQNIQFQLEGKDVGRRNTDTVNLRSVGISLPLQVTIGVGEQVNTLTIGGAAPPTPPAGLGWNTETELPEGAWTFYEENYYADWTPP